MKLNKIGWEALGLAAVITAASFAITIALAFVSTLV